LREKVALASISQWHAPIRQHSSFFTELGGGEKPNAGKFCNIVENLPDGFAAQTITQPGNAKSKKNCRSNSKTKWPIEPTGKGKSKKRSQASRNQRPKY